MLTGAGLLWAGWTGFNGGSPYAANIVAPLAILNTHIAAATSLLTWTGLDVFFFGKPSIIGAVQGMITGLVCITPGAGTSFLFFLFEIDGNTLNDANFLEMEFFRIGSRMGSHINGSTRRQHSLVHHDGSAQKVCIASKS